jgi:hypothetical protein
LTQALANHIADPKSIFYSTAAKKKREPKYLVKTKGLILELAELQHNLSFPAKTVEASLKEMLQAESRQHWFPTAEEKAAWIATMTIRIMRMTRDAQQGRTKNPNAEWVKMIFGSKDSGLQEDGEEEEEDQPRDHEEEAEEELEDGDGPEDREGVEGHGAEGPAVKEEEFSCSKRPAASASSSSVVFSMPSPWYVGYCPEHRQPFRVAVNDKNKFKEYTSSWVLPQGAAEHDAMLAEWPDGFKHYVEDMSVGNFYKDALGKKGRLEAQFVRKLEASRTSSTPAPSASSASASASAVPMSSSSSESTSGLVQLTTGTFWNGFHKATKEAVSVLVRPDKPLKDGNRRLICSIFGGSKRKQLLQFSLQHVDEKQHDLVKNIMKQVAQEYCNGLISKEGLVQRRDELGRKAGFDMGSKKGRKKRSRSPEVPEGPADGKTTGDGIGEEAAAPITPPCKASRADKQDDDEITGSSDSGFDSPPVGMVETIKTEQPLAVCLL